MRIVPIVALSLALGILPAAPMLALTYDGGPPSGGDCNEIAARIGAGATWYGEFAGNYHDSFREMYFPVSARGCFVSEYECRRWANEAMSFTGQGGIVYMRCTQGAPGY